MPTSNLFLSSPRMAGGRCSQWAVQNLTQHARFDILKVFVIKTAQCTRKFYILILLKCRLLTEHRKYEKLTAMLLPTVRFILCFHCWFNAKINEKISANEVEVIESWVALYEVATGRVFIKSHAHRHTDTQAIISATVSHEFKHVLVRQMFGPQKLQLVLQQVPRACRCAGKCHESWFGRSDGPK